MQVYINLTYVSPMMSLYLNMAKSCRHTSIVLPTQFIQIIMTLFYLNLPYHFQNAHPMLTKEKIDNSKPEAFLSHVEPTYVKNALSHPQQRPNNLSIKLL